jgi:Trypsin-like peptidase domain/Colicin V production protein
MTGLDWIIVAFTVLLATWGYFQGLVVSGLSLGGFLVGAIAGGRIAPLLLQDGSHSPYAPLFSLVGAVFLGTMIAVLLEALGSNIRRRFVLPPLRLLDGVGGALLIGTVALGLAWIAGAVALQTPGARKYREDIQRSLILRRLNDLLPPSGSILNALARVDPFPHVQGPEANVPVPRRGILRDPDVRAARGSVVRIRGTACGLAVEGSGWVAASGLVVTNAHVIAGQDDTTVQEQDGTSLSALPVAFDRHNDLAVLRVTGLALGPLPLRNSAPVGTPAAILGYPEDGPFRAVPARIGPTETVISQDAYGAGPIRRRITALRGEIRPGNSGGPVLDAGGRVVATVFAARRGRPKGGFGLPSSLVAHVLARAGGPVSSGPCVG